MTPKTRILNEEGEKMLLTSFDVENLFTLGVRCKDVSYILEHWNIENPTYFIRCLTDIERECAELEIAVKLFFSNK